MGLMNMSEGQLRSKVLVTGSTGFIGRALLSRLAAEKFTIRAVARNSSDNIFNEKFNVLNVGDIAQPLDWHRALEDVDIVIHLASRVHIMSDHAKDPSSEYRSINVDATLNLAKQAAESGVRRFIFMSSIKVNGEFTCLDEVFTADDIPAPDDPYSISKYQAELGLRAIACETGMEVVIIRPPLVYGPGVKANFLSMVRWLSRSIPLPLGSINNLRSLVAVDNLVDLIVICINHPGAANQLFLVSDDEDISTTSLLIQMGKALGKPALLIPVPVSWLIFFGALLGQYSAVKRLSSSLKVDISKTRNLLGWSPIIDLNEGFRRVAKDFKIK